MNEMLQFSMSHGGAVLFAIVFLEQAGLPIPEAPWLLAAGALSTTGQASPAMVIGVTVLSCLVADSGWFYIGRRGGSRVLQFLCRHLLPQSVSVVQIERSFVRYGMPVVAASKFLPGISVVVPPLAGALGIGAGRFLVFDLLGSALYAGFYLLLGAAFSDQVHTVFAVLHRMGIGSLILLLSLFAAYIAFKHNPWRRAHPRASEQEAPMGNIQQPASLC